MAQITMWLHATYSNTVFRINEEGKHIRMYIRIIGVLFEQPLELICALQCIKTTIKPKA